MKLYLFKQQIVAALRSKYGNQDDEKLLYSLAVVFRVINILKQYLLFSTSEVILIKHLASITPSYTQYWIWQI